MKKVIKASAGTGKTYRLSLEFINILLQYKDYQITFDEILVITFTRKATAEIRERIFSHLKAIVSGGEDSHKLKDELRQNNPSLQLDKQAIDYLRNIYENMLINKGKLNVSTIDAFITKIFNTLIAPYYNISDYKIDPNINDEYLPELFDTVLRDAHKPVFEELFSKAKFRNLKRFQDLIKDVIKYRWIFDHITEDLSIDETEKELHLKNYKTRIEKVMQQFQPFFVDYVRDNHISASLWQEYIKQEFYDCLSRVCPFVFSTNRSSEFSPQEFVSNILKVYTSSKGIEDFSSILLKVEYFWNGNKLNAALKKKGLFDELKDGIEEARDELAGYLFLEKLLPEQKKIRQLAKIILAKYDEIKFRDKIFTYDDITYYTYHYLYDPELSLVENGEVLNIFYEYLSYQIRFILIDEFQDTSIMQWKILRPIVEEVTSGYGQKPYGGMVVVGDEKQAIYNWRGGERDLLERLCDIVSQQEKPEILSKTYRSNARITEFVNTVFSRVGERQRKDSFQWDYNPVQCVDQSTGGYIEIHIRNRAETKSQPFQLPKYEIYEEIVRDILLPLLKHDEIDIANTAILARKNQELSEIAELLDAYHIPYVTDLSASIFHHKAVKPIMSLLSFFAFDDCFQLLKFLRSDYILMQPHELKQVVQAFTRRLSRTEFYQQVSDIPVMERIGRLEMTHHYISLLELVKACIEELNLHKLCQESDLKNIHRFLEIVAEFDASHHSYPCDLVGFIRHCKAIEKQEEYTQVSLEQSDAVKLLTIHRAKGLEFDNLFVVFDVSSRKGNFKQNLAHYTQFNENYDSLDDFALTFNYYDVLARSSKKYLVEEQEKRDAIEELNTYYVALTRAKSNLFLYFHYSSKKGLENYAIKSGDSVPKLMLASVYGWAKGKISGDKDLHARYSEGVPVKPEKYKEDISEAVAPQESAAKLDYFAILSHHMLVPLSRPRVVRNYKYAYLEKKSALKGTIAHYYLAQIEVDRKETRARAKASTIAEYGGVLPLPDIEKIIEKTSRFIDDNEQYFSREEWERIFTEYTVFDKNGKEYRIDRLLVNISKKNILILDFKTAEEYDEKQIQIYKDLIQQLQVVKQNKYIVSSQFLEIEL
jgi:ATP-dependent exoDNAse (exonuclease V) beta subunit